MGVVRPCCFVEVQVEKLILDPGLSLHPKVCQTSRHDVHVPTVDMPVGSSHVITSPTRLGVLGPQRRGAGFNTDTLPLTPCSSALRSCAGGFSDGAVRSVDDHSCFPCTPKSVLSFPKEGSRVATEDMFFRNSKTFNASFFIALPHPCNIPLSGPTECTDSDNDRARTKNTKRLQRRWRESSATKNT